MTKQETQRREAFGCGCVFIVAAVCLVGSYNVAALISVVVGLLIYAAIFATRKKPESPPKGNELCENCATENDNTPKS